MTVERKNVGFWIGELRVDGYYSDSEGLGASLSSQNNGLDWPPSHNYPYGNFHDILPRGGKSQRGSLSMRHPSFVCAKLVDTGLK